MVESIAIRPAGPLSATVRPPGSKSITNRALVCAALARGDSTLTGVLDSEDTQVMISALRQLGVVIEDASSAANRTELRIRGCNGRLPATHADLYIANSGTTVRFLAAVVALAHGHFTLDGTPRMRERPIEDLLAALRQLGVSAASKHGTGCPPVVIQANGLPGGWASVRGDLSSQFLSGLILASPYASQPVELDVEGELVSKPYIEMTLAVMAAFGVTLRRDDYRAFIISNAAGYRGRHYEIEPDASAASYFFAAPAIAGGSVTVEGLSRESLQGDVAFAGVLANMGCHVEYLPDRITVTSGKLAGVTVDMNAISDTVQTLSAVALFAEGATTIRGVAHIRHKETDRIHALAVELRKFGATVEEYPDGLRITPGPLRPATIDTYHDHRMAMSLALPGLRQPGVIINDPGCTNKTYPQFFADLARVCASASR